MKTDENGLTRLQLDPGRKMNKRLSQGLSFRA